MPDSPQTTQSPVIEVIGLSKQFGSFAALTDLSFTACQGEILGLLGTNGAGKTTTIHLLLGLITPSAGRIRILGRDLPEERREILKRVNFSSAYTALPSNLTVWENLNVFARLYGQRTDRKKIHDLLTLFEIPEVMDHLTGSLSSGQLTRLNLCKAFLNDPEILFLDEPTASLDPDIADKVRHQLRTLRTERRTTMIYTSHNMHEVETMCDRVIFLSHGKLVMAGPPAAIVQRAKSASLEELFISIARNGYIYEEPPDTEKPPCGSA